MERWEQGSRGAVVTWRCKGKDLRIRWVPQDVKRDRCEKLCVLDLSDHSFADPRWNQCDQLFETRITPQRIEHWIEPKQLRSERYVFRQ